MIFLSCLKTITKGKYKKVETSTQTCSFFRLFGISEMENDGFRRHFRHFIFVIYNRLTTHPRSSKISENVNADDHGRTFVRSKNNVQVLFRQRVDLQKQVSEFVEGFDVGKCQTSRSHLLHRDHDVRDAGQHRDGNVLVGRKL